MRMLLALAAPLLLSGAASVHTDFEGGSLGRIEKVTATHFRLGAKGETDQDRRNRQANWYFFRVDGAPDGEMIFDMIDLPGEYNYKPNRGAITKDTPPVVSFDGQTWKHVEQFEYDDAEPRLRLRITPRTSTFWVAHTPPYTNSMLAQLRSEIQHHRDFRQETIGRTLGKRNLELWTISSGKPAGKPTVWLMFRQHSWETGSSWAAEGAIRELLDDESKELREKFVWKILPLCDPDGVERGGVRFNARGFDLNRNWDVTDPVNMPEITAQRAAIKKWLDAGNRVDLFFSLHNTETGEYLEGPPDQARFAPLAERFAAALRELTTFAPTRPLSYAGETTTPGMKGRMTVIQGLYRDFGIPGFLMEQKVAYNSRLERLPEIPDRLKFGGELVRAVAAALEKGPLPAAK